MFVATGKIYLHANWVHSLKEKRMVVKSLVEKTKHNFNVSVAEIEDQDIHQLIVIGMACVSNDAAYANAVVEKAMDFIENRTDAVVQKIEVETF